MIHKSGEQWDFPNGWPPSNHMVIEGLRKSENPYSQEQGFRLAEKWVYGNYRVYLETGKMWEKYNVAEEKPAVGGGGEYQVQYGYGWTNGVILDLLTAYYDRFEWREASDAGSHLDEGGHNGGEREVVRYGFGWINAIILDLISAYYHHFEPNDGSGASNRLDDGVHGGEGNAGVRLLTSRNWLFPLISVASIAVLSNSSFLR
jgi:neutral trehalase